MDRITNQFDDLYNNNGDNKLIVDGMMDLSIGNDKNSHEGSEKGSQIIMGEATTTKDDDDPKMIDEKMERLWKEQERLLKKIQEIRKRRTEVKERIQKVRKYQTSWIHLRNKVEADRDRALQNYISIRKRDAATIKALEETKTLNVTNDCFHIWHRGPFATICGFRLGSEVPKLRVYSDPLVESKWTSFFLTDFDKSYFFDTNSASSSAASSKVDNFARVSWPEINSSLAMAALLLDTLQQKPNSCFVFKTHEIIPMGKHTKIGVRQPNGKPSILYNLYYDEDSFGTFLQLGRYRNFNTALSGLFMCLLDAAQAVSERDKAIVLPHSIQANTKGEITIGGLPITFGNTGRMTVTSSVPDGEQWTRAMKYFLTDLKWLITFTAKHVDR